MGKTTDFYEFSAVNMYTVDAIKNAKKWLYPAVPYSDTEYHTTFYGSYLANSAGFIAYAWQTIFYNGTNLSQISYAITKD